MSTRCAPSIDIYQRYLSDSGATHLIKSSIYVHAYRDGSKASLDTLDAQIRREKGAELEVIGVDALHRLEPYLNRSVIGAGLIKGQARAISVWAKGRQERSKGRRGNVRRDPPKTWLITQAVQVMRVCAQCRFSDPSARHRQTSAWRLVKLGKCELKRGHEGVIQICAGWSESRWHLRQYPTARLKEH